MEVILNRLRGMGKVFFKLTGNHLYAMYLALLFGLLTFNWIIGIAVLVTYFIGESFGWGKWVGSLCYPENFKTQDKLDKVYLDKEGYGFPFIHYLADFIVKEKSDYFLYCRVALGLRGAIWGALIYLPLVVLGYLSLYFYLGAILSYGIGFPLACWLSNLIEITYDNKYISINGKWETQEVYYGAIHWLVNTLAVVLLIRN